MFSQIWRAVWRHFLTAAVAAIWLASGAPVAADDNPLSLTEAVNLSLTAGDPSVSRFRETAEAEAERAVAVAQLPDPQLQLRAANVPTDTFRFNQEPMTQLQVGVRQAIPRGNTLRLQGNRQETLSAVAEARAGLAEAERALETRNAWLELYYLRGAQDVISESRQAVRDLIEVATSIYASGRSTSQDVLRADLELSSLEERQVQLAGEEALYRADLERLIGAAAARPLTNELPDVLEPLPIGTLRDQLIEHPTIDVLDAQVQVGDIDVDLAEQAYSPAWAIEAMYGERSEGRSDFASIGIVMDVPLFPGRRQDRRLEAARHDREAARLARSAHLLDLERDLSRTHAAWQRDLGRADLYRREIVPQSRATSHSVLDAYRNDVSDFPELVRARLAELEAELTLLRLEVDTRKAAARLIYLTGDDNAE